MHSGEIEGGRDACGHGSAAELEVDGRMPGCISVGDSDWNPVC